MVCVLCLLDVGGRLPLDTMCCRHNVTIVDQHSAAIEAIKVAQTRHPWKLVHTGRLTTNDSRRIVTLTATCVRQPANARRREWMGRRCVRIARMPIWLCRMMCVLCLCVCVYVSLPERVFYALRLCVYALVGICADDADEPRYIGCSI